MPHERTLSDALTSIIPVSAEAAAEADERQSQLTKPRGSMGALEILGSRLCAVSRTCPPPVPARPAVAVFAGDHGVHAQGVTPWPQEVTVQMVANFAAGGAVVNALARQVGATVAVVDVGLATEPVPAGALRRANVARATADLSLGPAMTREQALAAIEVGLAVADELVDSGADLLVTGDMGIANTTPAAALVALSTGAEPELVTGRGTGVDDAMLAVKTAVVTAVVDRVRSRSEAADAVDLLAEAGGFEHAALAGFLLGGAVRRVPVVVDGVIAASGALVAAALAPDAVGYWVAGHLSTEPGAALALESLGLTPLLDLDLRLGEGSGALLAVPLVQSAARILAEVATFDSAGVADK
jgi:nicotinate-nucleotide--dimethylbenzimidazole phosphoribosyltransferase